MSAKRKSWLGKATRVSGKTKTRQAKRSNRETSQFSFEKLENRLLLAINQPPVNTVPGTQETLEMLPLAFTPYRLNQISVSDPDAAENPIKVRLEVQHGTLSFAHPDPPGGDLTYLVGDGTNDKVIEFTAPQEIANQTMGWLYYTPPSYELFQWKSQNGGNDHWYEYISTPVGNWTQSRDFALARGGYLATITSQAEQNFVNSIIPSNSIYLGGYQDRSAANYIEPSGGWRWVTNEPWSFANWSAGEPNNANGNEDHLEIITGNEKKWNDTNGGNNRSLLIEYDSNPRPSFDTLTITSNDQGYFGTGGAKQDTDTVRINFTQLTFPPSPNWLTLPAAYDTGFDGDGRQVLSVSGGLDVIHEMRLLSNGKIIAAGAVNNRFGLLRFNSDLTLDTSFGINGVVESNFGDGKHALALEVDRQGRYVVGGNDFLARYLPSGQLDTSFGTNGRTGAGGANPIYDINIQADGKIVTTGNDDRYRGISFDRFLSNGLYEGSYSQGIYGTSRGIEVDDTGDSVITGMSFVSQLLITRANVKGVNEGGFEYDLPGSEFYRSSLRLPDGRMLVIGESNGDVVVSRHLASGALDNTFGTNGWRSFPVLNASDSGWRATLQADGKILITGQAYNGVNWDILVARMSYDGVLDTTFNSTGVRGINLAGDDFGYAVISQPDGKIVIAGRSGNDIALVRLYGDNDVFGERPSFDPLGDLTLNEDFGTHVVNLTGIVSGGSGGRPLRVTATSSYPTLLPAPTVQYVSPNETGTLTLSSVANLFGTAVITVTVEDGGEDGNLSTTADNRSYWQRFTVTVNSVNDQPTLDAINDLEMDENGPVQTVSLSGITAGGGESQALRISAVSSLPGVIPNPAVQYSSPNSTGSLSFQPLSNQSGLVTITVTVEDAGPDGLFDTLSDNRSFARTFRVNVIPDSAPAISVSFPQGPVAEANSGFKQVFFTVALSSAYNLPVSVDYATTSTGYANAATSGNDYTPVSGRLTFAPGETSKTVAVQVRGDRQIELDELFGMLLSNPTNGYLDISLADAMITDDDNWVYPLEVDFGTEVSPIKSGTAAVGALPFTTGKGLGWSTGLSNLQIVDRGLGTSGLRDLALTSSSTFSFNVPNGSYIVRINLGDATKAHDQMRVTLEGSHKPLVNTAINQFITRVFVANVADGRLDIGFTDMGGADPQVAIAGIGFDRR